MTDNLESLLDQVFVNSITTHQFLDHVKGMIDPNMEKLTELVARAEISLNKLDAQVSSTIDKYHGVHVQILEFNDGTVSNVLDSMIISDLEKLFSSYITKFLDLDAIMESIYRDIVETDYNANQLNYALKYNIYNKENYKDFTGNMMDIRMKYVIPNSLGHTWYSGKFTDKYLSDPNAFIDIFKLREKEHKVSDNFNESGIINDHVMFHPDYGLMQITTTNLQTINPKTITENNSPLFPIDIKTNDGFVSEFNESKGIESKDTTGDEEGKYLADVNLQLRHFFPKELDTFDFTSLGHSYFIVKTRTNKPLVDFVPHQYFIGKQTVKDESTESSRLGDSSRVSGDTYEGGYLGTSLNVNKDSVLMSSETNDKLITDTEDILQTKLNTGLLTKEYANVGTFFMNYRNNEITYLMKNYTTSTGKVYPLYNLKPTDMAADNSFIYSNISHGSKGVVNSFSLFSNYVSRIFGYNTNDKFIESRVSRATSIFSVSELDCIGDRSSEVIYNKSGTHFVVATDIDVNNGLMSKYSRNIKTEFYSYNEQPYNENRFYHYPNYQGFEANINSASEYYEKTEKDTKDYPENINVSFRRIDHNGLVYMGSSGVNDQYTTQDLTSDFAKHSNISTCIVTDNNIAVYQKGHGYLYIKDLNDSVVNVGYDLNCTENIRGDVYNSNHHNNLVANTDRSLIINVYELGVINYFEWGNILNSPTGRHKDENHNFCILKSNKNNLVAIYCGGTEVLIMDLSYGFDNIKFKLIPLPNKDVLWITETANTTTASHVYATIISPLINDSLCLNDNNVMIVCDDRSAQSTSMSGLTMQRGIWVASLKEDDDIDMYSIKKIDLPNQLNATECVQINNNNVMVHFNAVSNELDIYKVTVADTDWERLTLTHIQKITTAAAKYNQAVYNATYNPNYLLYINNNNIVAIFGYNYNFGISNKVPAVFYKLNSDLTTGTDNIHKLTWTAPYYCVQSYSTYFNRYTDGAYEYSVSELLHSKGFLRFNDDNVFIMIHGNNNVGHTSLKHFATYSINGWLNGTHADVEVMRFRLATDKTTEIPFNHSTNLRYGFTHIADTDKGFVVLSNEIGVNKYRFHKIKYEMDIDSDGITYFTATSAIGNLELHEVGPNTANTAYYSKYSTRSTPAHFMNKHGDGVFWTLTALYSYRINDTEALYTNFFASVVDNVFVSDEVSRVLTKNLTYTIAKEITEEFNIANAKHDHDTLGTVLMTSGTDSRVKPGFVKMGEWYLKSDYPEFFLLLQKYGMNKLVPKFNKDDVAASLMREDMFYIPDMENLVVIGASLENYGEYVDQSIPKLDYKMTFESDSVEKGIITQAASYDSIGRDSGISNGGYGSSGFNINHTSQTESTKGNYHMVDYYIKAKYCDVVTFDTSEKDYTGVKNKVFLDYYSINKEGRLVYTDTKQIVPSWALHGPDVYKDGYRFSGIYNPDN